MSTCGCNSSLDQAIVAAKAATNLTLASDNTHLNIHLLYIDLSVCDRCQGTERNLDSALASVEPVLKSSGYSYTLSKILIESEEQAREQKFISSPTIRINGHDIQLNAQESHCADCSALVEDLPVDCRSWEYRGVRYDAPPTSMIIEAIMKHLYGVFDEEKPKPYKLPKNLKRFFAARFGEKERKEADSCCDTSSSC